MENKIIFGTIVVLLSLFLVGVVSAQVSEKPIAGVSIACEKDSDCVLGIRIDRCCNCPAIYTRQEVEKDPGLVVYEIGKDYSSIITANCKDVVCSACPPTYLTGSIKCINKICTHISEVPVCGDVNCDGKIDVNDRDLLMNYVGYPGQYQICSEWAADVTCDGKINVGDVVLLQYHISDPGKYSLKCCGETDGLVGYWKFDEGSGITAMDSSGSGNDGTLFNGPTWVDGKLGKALQFDGTNDYVDCGNNSSFNIADAITMEAWVKPNMSDDPYLNKPWFPIVSKGTSYLIWIEDTAAFYPWFTIGDTIVGIPWQVLKININDWNHVAATYSSETKQINIYIDGVYRKTQTLSDLPYYTIDPFYDSNLTIGYYPYPYWFNGIIDEVRIYNRSLSSEEILSHYQGKEEVPPVPPATFEISKEQAIEIAKEQGLKGGTVTYEKEGKTYTKDLISAEVGSGSLYELNKGNVWVVSTEAFLEEGDLYVVIVDVDSGEVLKTIESGKETRKITETPDIPGITKQFCDAMDPCPEGLEGLECFSFPSIGLRCAQPNPCSYFKCPEGTQCALTTSYPGQVICSGKCEGDYCETGVSYDVLTGKVEIMKGNKRESIEITLHTAPGYKGILETPTVSVKVSQELVIEESKLLMKTSAGKKAINVLPEDAVAASKTPNIEAVKIIELKEESQKPVYSVKGIKQARLLFIIPVSLEIETKVDAKAGNVISVNKPWWSFLAW